MAVDRIIIFCDNPSDKHGKKHPNPIVWAYRYDESHKDGVSEGWVDGAPSKRLKNAADRQHGAQTLVGNEKFDVKKFNAANRDVWVDHLRESWLLGCEKCGYRVPIVGAKLYPVLHRMRHIGVDRIGLGALQAGLRQS